LTLAHDEETPEPDETPVWREPRDGVPPLIENEHALAEYAAALSRASGPLAVDAERASGFRYSQRAYLVQLRRTGAGTALVDPVCTPDMTLIQNATAGTEWILHAATQDLACLREVGLVPSTLFDTELAGRLLGRERVSLGALVLSELGAHLEKGHGASDWSQRPLSPALLRYAALDVELLIELRDTLEQELAEAGKLEWAREEFDALLSFTPRDRGEDAWRRTSGMHRVRKPRNLAVVRSLWQARDAVAQRIDTAQGRVLSDTAIVAAASTMPPTIEELGALPEFSNRGAQRRLRIWWEALEEARGLPESALPEGNTPAVGPPPARTWHDKRPEAAARLDAAKQVMAELSESVLVPVENLLQPDALRRACWDGVSGGDLAQFLHDCGARNWQIELTVTRLATAIDTAKARTLPPEATDG
jgi:ribonuclease D